MALGGSFEFAALTPPALLGRAGLVVDEDRRAFGFAERELDDFEIVAVMYLDARRHRQARIGIGKLAEEHDLGDALRQHLPNYVEYGKDRKSTRLNSSH